MNVSIINLIYLRPGSALRELGECLDGWMYKDKYLILPRVSLSISSDAGLSSSHSYFHSYSSITDYSYSSSCDSLPRFKLDDRRLPEWLPMGLFDLAPTGVDTMLWIQGIRYWAI